MKTSPFVIRHSSFTLALLLALLLPFAATTARADTNLSVTAANVAMSASGLYKTQNAAGTITAGQAVYYDTVAGGLKTAGNTGLGGNPVAGIAVNGGSSGQLVTYCYQDPNFKLGATVTSGLTVWLSTTAGGLTTTAADVGTGETAVVLGVTNSTTTMNLNIVNGGAVP